MRTVMVVDDDVLVHEMVRQVVSAEDRVISVKSSREALSVLAAGERVDVMLVDSSLPVSKEEVLLPVKPGERFVSVLSNTVLIKPFSLDALKKFVDDQY